MATVFCAPVARGALDGLHGTLASNLFQAEPSERLAYDRPTAGDRAMAAHAEVRRQCRRAHQGFPKRRCCRRPGTCGILVGRRAGYGERSSKHSTTSRPSYPDVGSRFRFQRLFEQMGEKAPCVTGARSQPDRRPAADTGILSRGDRSRFASTDAANLTAAGVDAAALTGPSWRDQMKLTGEARAQQLARNLVAQGYRGMLVPSFAQGAAAGDLNLVLWRWGGSAPFRLGLIDDERRLG